MPSSDDAEELPSRATEGTTHASAPSATSFERCERFAMSQQLVYVRQAWREYTQELPALQSIREVEAICGTQWRHNNRDTQFYCRRKPLFDSIALLMADQNASEDCTVALHEKIRGGRGLSTMVAMTKRELIANKGSFINVHLEARAVAT